MTAAVAEKRGTDAHIKSERENYVRMRPLYFTVDRNEFTGAPRRNIHDCLWPRGFPPPPPPPPPRPFVFPSSSFARIYAFARVAQAATTVSPS